MTFDCLAQQGGVQTSNACFPTQPPRRRRRRPAPPTLMRLDSELDRPAPVAAYHYVSYIHTIFLIYCADDFSQAEFGNGKNMRLALVLLVALALVAGSSAGNAGTQLNPIP